MTHVSRRTVAGSVPLAGLGIPLLAACAGEDEADGQAPDPSAQRSEGAAGLAATADIEVGGGTIIADQGVVVTQPSDGDFKAFTATCPHQGCLVNAVSEGKILCPCHGSSFSIDDGSVQGGPASSGLSEVAITVEGDSITLA